MSLKSVSAEGKKKKNSKRLFFDIDKICMLILFVYILNEQYAENSSLQIFHKC